MSFMYSLMVVVHWEHDSFVFGVPGWWGTQMAGQTERWSEWHFRSDVQPRVSSIWHLGL